MFKICPKCGAIAEFNAYYGRTTCTRCTWESENVRRQRVHVQQFNDSMQSTLKKSMESVKKSL